LAGPAARLDDPDQGLNRHRRADQGHDQRAQDRRPAQGGRARETAQPRRLEQAAGVDERDPDRGQDAGQSEAEGDDKQEAESDLPKRDRAEQQDQRRRTRQQAAGDPERDQAARRDAIRRQVVVVVRTVVVTV